MIGNIAQPVLYNSEDTNITEKKDKKKKFSPRCSSPKKKKKFFTFPNRKKKLQHKKSQDVRKPKQSTVERRSLLMHLHKNKQKLADT